MNCTFSRCQKRVRYYRNHSLDGATLFSKLDSYKLRFNVKNEMTLICAKFDADLINISKVTSRKTKWPRFFGLLGSASKTPIPVEKITVKTA